MATIKQKITPCLWFDNNRAEEAANLYVSLFKNSKVNAVAHYSDEAASVAQMPKGAVLTVAFTLDGQNFLALNGGPMFKFTEAVSFIIHCEDQEEIDFFWKNLIKDGGQPSRCGWLKDKFGLSWQVVPAEMDELMKGQNGEKVMHALLQMDKLDLGKLRAAKKA
jgi:predicted 3-demethylubiquinone-9 3-methyltransferase (glyoxalase superfamily)